MAPDQRYPLAWPDGWPRTSPWLRGPSPFKVTPEKAYRELVQELDFTYAPILFELEYLRALSAKMPRFEEISRFPRVRRDLAVVVDEKVSLRQLHERVTFAASSLLRDIRVFDVFRGPGIENGRKSVALGLIFQDNSRTLADEDADRLLAAIRADLSATLGAGFRE